MAELCRKNAHPPVGCVIMASGLARRFGSNKLLANFGAAPALPGAGGHRHPRPCCPGGRDPLCRGQGPV